MSMLKRLPVLLSKMTIRAFLAGMFILAIILITLVVGFGANYWAKKSVHEENLIQWQDRIYRDSRLIVTNLSVADFAAINRTLQNITLDDNVLMAEVITDSGVVLGPYGEIDLPATHQWSIPLTVKTGPSKTTAIGTFNAHMMLPAPTYWDLSNVGALFAMTAFATAIVFLSLYWVIAAMISRPIACLREAAESYALSQPHLATAKGASEIRALSKSINTMMSRIRKDAQVDSVTGGFNRQYMEHHINELTTLFDETNGEMTFGVLFIDIDHFKHINDSYGHLFGDQLLENVSSRFQSILAPEITIGRFGGDEFLVAIPGINDEQSLTDICNSIMEAINPNFVIDNVDVSITISIGGAIMGRDGQNLSELLIAADKALYDAKYNGRNGYKIYNNSMALSSSLWVETANQLRYSLQQSTVEHYYQPIFCMKTKQISSFELLLRMRNQHNEFISPEYLLEIAANFKFDQQLTKVTLQNAAELTNTKHFQTTINLSVNQLRYCDVSSFTKQAAKLFKVTSDFPIIEVTEESFIENEVAIQQMKRLHAAGFRIALDDFGTGYASLASLKNMPLTYVKIDKVFINEALSSNRSFALLEMIIQLCKKMRFIAIIEGVESAEDFDLVSRLDCDYAQGYWIGKPAPLSEIDATADKISQHFSAPSNKVLALV